jgi:Icc-related predicted phosphoesterase
MERHRRPPRPAQQKREIRQEREIRQKRQNRHFRRAWRSAAATALLALGLAGGGCRAAPAATASSSSCAALPAQPRAALRLGSHHRLALGAVAGTHGVTPATREQLAALVARFRESRVDALVALGDLGANADEIAEVLTTLGQAGVPVLALPGEQESENAFHSAVERARNAGVDIIDLVAKRIVDTGEIDIVSVPGYPVSPDGCRYDPGDLTALRAAAAGRYRPLVLLAHTPPRGEGPQAVDWNDGANVGDRGMLDLINALYPNAALFAHADDAGGRMQRAWLNVGAVARGMAARVELVDGIARVQRLP